MIWVKTAAERKSLQFKKGFPRGQASTWRPPERLDCLTYGFEARRFISS